MSLYRYGNQFFAYQRIGSLASARVVAPLVMHHLHASSVLDVGCGAGAWVRSYLEAGASDAVGVDAPYMATEQLMFEPSRFRSFDVGASFRLGRQFDVAQCLEVAEHLRPATSEILVDNLVAHAGKVVFSAAPPGQGGENHVNERPYEFWRSLFERRRFLLFDFLRPRIMHRHEIEPWYRYNLMLFVQEDFIPSLDADVRASQVHGDRVPDLAPLGWRARRRLLSCLPAPVVTAMASAKHRLLLRGSSLERS
jgi:SAM-dependent methyltransferase